MQTAKEFWKERFGEEPQTDSEKLAVTMMSEYADYFSQIETKVNQVEAQISPACGRKLIISIENDTVLFDNLNDFKPLEFMGILHNAISTADVLYKTKVMLMVKKASKSGGDIMKELEYKISKLLQEQQPITESEAQDLAHFICELPELKAIQVQAKVKVQIANIIDAEISMVKFELEIQQDDSYEYGIDIAKEKIKLLEKLKQQISNLSA